MNAKELIRGGRRQKLFNGAVIDHPYLGRITVRVEDEDGHQPHWQAWQGSKPVTPLYFSERSLHWGLKWYAHGRRPCYTLANSTKQLEPAPPPPNPGDDPALKAAQADWLRRHNVTLR